MQKCNGYSVKQQDAALLREALCWVYKRSPGQVQAKINQVLTSYAARVGQYCEHPENTYIELEKTHACLDCGHRNKRLKVIENESD